MNILLGEVNSGGRVCSVGLESGYLPRDSLVSLPTFHSCPAQGKPEGLPVSRTMNLSTLGCDSQAKGPQVLQGVQGVGAPTQCTLGNTQFPEG